MATPLKRFVVALFGTSLIGFAALTKAADPVVIIISHPVEDFAEWKKRFDGGKANREKAGLRERYVMRDAEKPNNVIVVFETSSVENAKKFVSDPGFKERIKKASTTGSAEIRIGTTSPTKK